jgi:hypothetical protein
MKTKTRPNGKETISASELNSFAYCPRQWFHGRVRGAAAVREAYRERNRELGLDDAALSNLSRGLSRHRSFVRRRMVIAALKAAAFAAAALGAYYVFTLVK